MFYLTPWTSDPWFQPSLRPINAVYPGTYPSPYARPAVPFLRNESIPIQHSVCISKAEVELNQVFRLLWEQHVAWTRMLIISIAANLPDEALVTEHLLRNPPDMAAVFKRYYGEEIAARFNSLMRDHLVLAAQLVKAAKAGNKQAAAEFEKKWYANADEIAAFLNRINPNWPTSVLMNMLHEHLRMTKDEAVFRLSKKYKSDIEAFDQIEKQALEMADAFTKGIVQQFPHAFK
ncbi:LysM peptidoglycan-binding domain-containing protein [Paenibacillus filicis]|uniref:LysM peptidoglycan-binding domain-containing protein n=1 Tax=Paenibacillus gyeongsangnamensis TaxID=3388067 RepID=A0ABT4Q848_9BACL|nr:LysM peptidoglycan-binding domain-containing protein [Paenibacillus filicis]MCZ8513047.1 LysM peptidoglycan-binding domain-containing protein [Paenibacillus filicis]